MAEEPTKAEPTTEEEEKLVLFASSGDLDKMWATLILATTGAAMGQRVTVFFTFWGLFPLVSNEVRITGENWMQQGLSVLNRGGTEHLKLGKMNLAGMGPRMMRKLATENKVASPTELLELARDMGVLVEGLGEPAGATTALLEAKGATALFV